jgi:hypothetical protein
VTSLLARVVERTPLTGHMGRSENALERVVLDDGTRLAIKRMVRGGWPMRATHDPGVRDVLLWTSGVLSRVPSVIDHAIVGVEPDREGRLIIMRDVADALIPRGLWFRGQRAGESWRRPFSCTPSSVARRSPGCARSPTGTGCSRRQCSEASWPRGDVGLVGDRVIFLDWGLLTGVAPPAVELAYYPVMRAHHARIDASNEELIEDFRACDPEHFDARALRLALLGSMVMFSSHRALQCVEGPDEDSRRASKKDFAWWLDRSREALDEWAPSENPSGEGP